MPQDYPDRNLLTPIEPQRVPEVYRSTVPIQDEEAVQALPVSHYLWILKRHRWKIAAFVTASIVATLVVSSRLQPIYEAKTTIDVDRQTPTGVIGQESIRTATNVSFTGCEGEPIVSRTFPSTKTTNMQHSERTA